MVSLMFSTLVFSQKPASLKQEYYNSKMKHLERSYDNNWYFFPVSFNLFPGIYLPIGKLSEYYYPGFQFGFSLELMISKKIRIEYVIVPRFMNNKNQIEVYVNDTILKTNTPMSGSIGGSLSYNLYKNKHIFLELFSGLAWEPIDTEIIDPNPKNDKDSLLDISTMGFSIGINTWINTFRNHNFGVKTVYNYAGYNRDKILKSNIGGHSFSVSLVYKFPKRDEAYRKYF